METRFWDIESFSPCFLSSYDKSDQEELINATPLRTFHLHRRLGRLVAGANARSIESSFVAMRGS
jgi:hypothetical protein